MRCEVCGKTRAVFSLEVREGQEIERKSLCQACARESQKSRLGQGLEFLLTDLLPEQDGYNTHEGIQVCACCHTTSAEISENRKPGCPDCYTIFSREIDAQLREMHGGTRHFGKKKRISPEGRVA